VAAPTSIREQVAAALFSLVSTNVGQAVTLVTSSRILRHYDQVTPAEMPALFQAQTAEKDERGALGLPNKRTMRFELWLYTAIPQEPSAVPSTLLNIMVDAIETSMAGAVPTGIQTLGGLVASARIDGNVEFAEGLTSDGKSLAVVPIAVLIP
jgi:hypothetical protein